MIEFFVPGAAVAGGSKRGFPIRGRDGRTHVNVTDASGPRGREWRAAIRLAAAGALGRAHGVYDGSWSGDGPLRLTLWFYVARPKGHTGKRGLRRGAPAFPTTRPDATKLTRAVEDACTGILWGDDAQIVDQDVHKLYADGGLPIGVRVRVAALDDRRRPDLYHQDVASG